MQTYANYTEMRQHLGELFQEGQFAEAAELLTWAINEYPEKLEANSYNLAACHAALGQVEQSIQALQTGLEGGVWFTPGSFDPDLWEPIRTTEEFKSLLPIFEAKTAELQARTKLVVDIVLPKDYTPDLQYPLFLALHGGGENLEIFKPQWKSSRLENDFIAAYLQSSQVMGMSGFSWENLDQTQKDVIQAYEQIVAEYPVDRDQVIVGGFSDGGRAALFLATQEKNIPLRGYVVLCPPIPETFSAEAAAQASAREIVGVILTSEKDQFLEAQKEAIEIFVQQEVSVRLVETPDIGHWYPDDFSEQLDTAIEFILA
jgi:predicted esterase